jgi:tRNA modification GTPase
MSPAETIVALATAPGRAGVAILRLSGPQAGAALVALTGTALPAPRRAARARFRHPADGRLLDDGLVLWFPGPASFTGEDVGELHCHGGRAVVDSLLEALCTLPDVRPAEPGEFSRRAFDHGKMDLTQAEAVADLVAAETAGQQRQALRQMDGALGRLYDGWRDALIAALAHLEAYIDFPDEDVPEDVSETVRHQIRGLRDQITLYLEDGHRGERLREGFQIAVVGPPNAGKSSLVNALARREAAIVAATAGTTRDVVEVHLDLGGYPAILADTAGLREAAEEIEAEGVRRALARAEAADLRLVVLDAAAWPEIPAEARRLMDDRAVVVVNKCDLRPALVPLSDERPVVPVSVLTGAGMDGLLRHLHDILDARVEAAGPPAPTRERHRAALEESQEALERAATTADLDLMAEDLRLAARALGRITGRVEVEELLDVIFRDFCIGK